MIPPVDNVFKDVGVQVLLGDFWLGFHGPIGCSLSHNVTEMMVHVVNIISDACYCLCVFEQTANPK